VAAVGRGGFVVARLICDFLVVDNLLCVPVKWVEQSPRLGEKYVAVEDAAEVYEAFKCLSLKATSFKCLRGRTHLKKALGGEAERHASV